MNDRTIGWDFVGKYCVSTVKLTIDHGFGLGPPQWYETMVFAAEGDEVTDWGELYCERYATQEEAIEGHARVFQMAQRGELNDGEVS